MAITGIPTGSYDGITKVYRNNGGGAFVDSWLSFGVVFGGSAAWGDYDNDGDLDLAVSGTSNGHAYTRVFRNDGGAFNSPPTAPSGLTVTKNGTDLNISWAASTDTQTPSAGLCYNIRVGTAPGKDNIFNGMADAATGFRRLPALGNAQKRLSWAIKNTSLKSYYCSVQAIDTSFAGSAWADEKSIVVPKISGLVTSSGGAPVAGVIVSANNGGTSATSDATGYYELWVPVGWSGTVMASKDSFWFSPGNRTYTNLTVDQPNQDYSGATLSAGASISPVNPYAAAWGDFDNDGDLDLLVAGDDSAYDVSQSNPTCKIYRNDGQPANARPAAPTNLSAVESGGNVTFSWAAGSDAKTPASGLTYNLRIGTTPGGNDIMSGNADSTGLRSIPTMGNVEMRLSWTLKNVPNGIYYWGIQAIDTTFAGSPWATGQITVGDVVPPVINSVTVTPAMVAAGDLLHVSVDATDNIGVTSVTVNGVALMHGTGNMWSGDLAVSPNIGAHTVLVVATDAAGHSTSDASKSYKTALVYGISGRATRHDIVSSVYGNHLFKVWGKVTAQNSTKFLLDDGSGILVKVICPNYDVETGDFASARGILDPTTDPPTLTTSMQFVKKLR